MKNRIITVKDTDVTVATKHEQDYICLTDMVKRFDGGSALIEQWLKNKDTVLFLGVWEQLNNPGFNSLEFEGIKNEAGRNSFFLSVKKWIDATAAIGLHAKAGRYGGTYAHKDIAFEFGSWLSPEFSSASWRSISSSGLRSAGCLRSSGCYANHKLQYAKKSAVRSIQNYPVVSEDIYDEIQI